MPNQRWNVLYTDKAPKPITKGLNKAFGFYVNRPFYIVSMLPMNRVVEVVQKRNIVIKSRVGKAKKTQQWVFDGVSKTIKSVQFKTAFDIANEGKSNSLQLYKSNSRWF